jgi:hypothetical protein
MCGGDAQRRCYALRCCFSQFTMVSLKLQKRLAASVLKVCGLGHTGVAAAKGGNALGLVSDLQHASSELSVMALAGSRT